MKYSLIGPVNSLIQDAVNGLPTLRCLKQKNYFIDRLYSSIDTQTSAHITSNGGNRWTALRIDMQAYIISTSFAAYAIFFTAKNKSVTDLAFLAVGLQNAMELTRQFDMAIRWSVDFENVMGSVQRLMQYTKLDKEHLLHSQHPMI